jgi:hypothetical protein
VEYPERVINRLSTGNVPGPQKAISRKRRRRQIVSHEAIPIEEYGPPDAAEAFHPMLAHTSQKSWRFGGGGFEVAGRLYKEASAHERLLVRRIGVHAV